MTTPLYLTYLEKSLVDDFIAMLNQQAQQAQPAPPQLPAPQDAERPRPYYAGPSPEKVDRQRLEHELRALVEMSTARLYEMLKKRLDEMQAQQARQIEAERQRGDVERQKWLLEVERSARVSASRPAYMAIEASPCTPSRRSLISSRQDFYS